LEENMENIMNREAMEKAIDTGYYKGIDLDAESYVPVSFEKAEDGYVLRFKDQGGIFDVPISSGLLARILRSLRARRLTLIEESENLHESLQPAPLKRSA
jgi:hypothetical protein